MSDYDDQSVGLERTSHAHSRLGSPIKGSGDEAGDKARDEAARGGTLSSSPQAEILQAALFASPPQSPMSCNEFSSDPFVKTPQSSNASQLGARQDRYSVDQVRSISRNPGYARRPPRISRGREGEDGATSPPAASKRSASSELHRSESLHQVAPRKPDAGYSYANDRRARLQNRLRKNQPLHKDSGYVSFSQDQAEIAMLREPEPSRTTPERLAVQVKGIYAGLVLVEAKCINVIAVQTKSQGKETKHTLSPEQWKVLIDLHRTLLCEHFDFLTATNHPSATHALRALPAKYSMPARMWRHGIHTFLEFLRSHRPGSQDFMLSFIYLAYQMIALLSENVPTFKDTWIECLGDLARYRMAIEDNRDVHATWGGVAVRWYTMASDSHPTTGRLYHHLGILERPGLRKFSFYTKSLVCAVQFHNAKDSLKTLCASIIKDKQLLLGEGGSDEGTKAIVGPRSLIEEGVSSSNMALEDDAGPLSAKNRSDGPTQVITRPRASTQQSHAGSGTSLEDGAVAFHTLYYSGNTGEPARTAGRRVLHLLAEPHPMLRETGVFLAIVNINAVLDYGSPENLVFKACRSAIEQTAPQPKQIEQKKVETEEPKQEAQSALVPLLATEAVTETDTSALDISSMAASTLAREFWSGCLNSVLRAYDKPALHSVLPFVHVNLLFLIGLHDLPTYPGSLDAHQAFISLQVCVSWPSLADLLNSVIKASDAPSEDLTACASKGHLPCKSNEPPLPDDFYARGHSWCWDLYQADFFDGQSADDGRFIEVDKQKPRMRRVVWCGLYLAFRAKCLHYDEENKAFSALGSGPGREAPDDVVMTDAPTSPMSITTNSSGTATADHSSGNEYTSENETASSLRSPVYMESHSKEVLP